VTTVQLRRYRVEPGRMADFLAWFPKLRPVRAQYGFRLLFALADHEHDTFTWAVAHDGDEAAFREVEATYNASPERAAVFETFPACIADMEIGFAQDVLTA
jgi:antibiotic biosynthesis monooxygenase (ABM) superfamily enzyme